MAVLTKDQILSANDVVKEMVAVPEWGGEVWVRTPTGRARDEFEGAMIAATGKPDRFRNIRARLCAACICDERGVLLFDGWDVEALGDKSAAALDRVFAVAQRLAGLSAGDMEELEGNSESAPAGASGSS